MPDEKKDPDPAISKDDFAQMFGPGAEAKLPDLPVKPESLKSPVVPLDAVMRHLILEPAQKVAAAYEVTPIARALGVAGTVLVTQSAWARWIAAPEEKVASKAVANRIARLLFGMVYGLTFNTASGKPKPWIAVRVWQTHHGVKDEGQVWTALSLKDGQPFLVVMDESEKEKFEAAG